MKTVRVQRKYGPRTAVANNASKMPHRLARNERLAVEVPNGHKKRNPPQTGARSLTARTSRIPGSSSTRADEPHGEGPDGPEKHPTVRAKSAPAPPSSVYEAGTLRR